MTPAEAGALLAWVSTIDNRRVTREAAHAWAEVLPDVDVGEAKAAATAHFREQPGVYLMPAHVLAGVKRARAARLADAPAPLPVADPDDVAGYLAEVKRLASGGRRQIGG
ncbi:hypothetical protein [Cellulomonas sp.]|uniref:hypothetical protein n=1 Tax=Cellulomonas sp. TaxID=40001 RepID=UPI001B1414EA|nr:hypothetical protein [Cellulomonas sp.]MBO9555567.1 hypothetical protein [Cellulomonas sp.]